jgi:diguanylate cyclase (GGDEF)-like protein
VSDLAIANSGRDFASPYLTVLLRFVQREHGADAVATVLQQAGETRTVEEICDGSSWSSYAQFRRLMEAGSTVLGGLERMEAAGSSGYDDVPNGQVFAVMHELGSPEGLMRDVAATGASVAPLVSLQATETGPRDWLIRQSFVAGFEPFEEFCAFAKGLYRVIPQLFGFAGIDVTGEQCQCMGADSCVVRVRWDDVDEITRQANYFEGKARVFESQLQELRHMVGELVSADGLETVLNRTLASAGRALTAPVFVLALDADTVATQRVYATGIETVEANRIAKKLLRGKETYPDSWLVVDVASTRHSYGRLAAVRPTKGYLAPELPVLQAYGRLAAAALDSASTLDEARRLGEEASKQAEEARQQGATAHALLELSTTLAEISSVDEMAAKLVRAVPPVVGCDRAAVILATPDRSRARVAAHIGFPKRVEGLLRELIVPIPDTLDDQIVVRDPASQIDDIGRNLMAETGSTFSITIPILIDGEWVGCITASVTGDPSRLRDAADADKRLRGLAAQATTAIRNARLLDQVRHQAFHDPLTGLPNRALILDRVEQMLVRARRQGRPAAVMFIDLDGFKDVNDTLGHATGDQLLRAVSTRLTTTLREMDTVGRLGGDEFVVLTDGGSVDVGPELVAERLLAVLSEPFHLEGGVLHPLSISASIGIAIGDRPSAGELLRDADIALYQAKAAGKACFTVFEPEMQTAVQDRIFIQMDLQQALKNEQFFLVYQPVFTLATGNVTGVEALLRWDHPIRGEIQPNEFIPLLEESDLIGDVGRWVLREACLFAASWPADDRALSIAVNVSARQLQVDQFVDDVRNALTESGLDPNRLVLEITETAIIADLHATSRRLAALKKLGIRVAIDDFGTAYSSLAYLRELPVDTLKIDQAFVNALGKSEGSEALVHTLVQLGKTLGLETVAEGIEELAQYQRLENEACDSGQGFLIARPLTTSALRKFLDDHHQSQQSAI